MNPIHPQSPFPATLEPVSAPPSLPVSASSSAAWMLRPLKERVFLKWRVRIEYSHVAGGKLIHDVSPWFEVVAPEGEHLLRVALTEHRDKLPPGARIENWKAELKEPKAVDGCTEMKPNEEVEIAA